MTLVIFDGYATVENDFLKLLINKYLLRIVIYILWSSIIWVAHAVSVGSFWDTMVLALLIATISSCGDKVKAKLLPRLKMFVMESCSI
jgi:hypothetical protein